ncbi:MULTISPECIES: vWA domain-containing protein [unclassified Rhodococcus (in: high G+C Gram-positive bacteria)]|uniref:vWA domain-containing protein n=1 Tax=unclassified Rhodococcus (in: high G+C Gram-positive bacteria) TaxID=192944 RepID=UPI000E2ABC52|nr:MULTISPECIES: VWA domain-containing protein [unclassified Rhodococcus (in: high G+C Gram-positive bacteria)]QKT11443.1 VWA domain-containing protein [Rhodococcus sp. W8901]RDI21847.1 stress response protein SCP2 [Rhodococcus sp. AG1013]
MTALTRGANTSVATTATTIGVTGTSPGSVDLFVFQLDERRKVRSDEDLVFFNNPTSPEGAVTLVAQGQVRLDLAAIPAGIERIAIAVSVDETVTGPLSAVPALAVAVTQPGGTTVTAAAEGLTTERSAVLLEVYRRNGAWKVRNVSAGWNDGLVALVTEHGVAVDDTPAQPTTSTSVPAVTATAPTPPAGVATVDADGVRTVPAEAKLSLEKRQKLDLRKKEVAKVLLANGARDYVGRVILVIDKTGSMSRRYSDGEVQETVRRMVPVATQLDADGQLEAYLYGVNFAKLPDVTVDRADQWIDEYIHLQGVHGGIDYDNEIGGFNDEIPIMTEVLAGLDENTTVPTLILFFTDGGFSKRSAIEKLMRRASSRPAFWQFIGIGRSSFGVLEKLDTMSGRKVDNAGFFSVNKVDALSDAELYRLLLSEYPDWLRAARAAHILR